MGVLTAAALAALIRSKSSWNLEWPTFAGFIVGVGTVETLGSDADGANVGRGVAAEELINELAALACRSSCFPYQLVARDTFGRSIDF